MKTCGVGYTFLGDREFDSLRSLLRLDDVETKKISFGGEVTFANPRISFEIPRNAQGIPIQEFIRESLDFVWEPLGIYL